jgi:hypothetical protein
MPNNLKVDANFVKHPTQEGVFMKHFYGKDDGACINNLEVNIVLGFQIAPHTHENSSEFFYAAAGNFWTIPNGKP